LKVLVVGHGAREHAIVRKLAEEEIEIYAGMGRLNPGIEDLSENVEIIDINDPSSYNRFKGMDLAIIGPEGPLAAGIVDKLEEMAIPTMGPRRSAAKLEWSKAYTREILERNNIPGNPDYKICGDISDVKNFLDIHNEVAVKPDGLTGGKGVKITGEHLKGRAETIEYASKKIKEDGLVILEEKLQGKEFVLQSFTDGNRVVVMPLVRDYKRAYDGDRGPNTGSMGSFSSPDHKIPDISEKSIRRGKEIIESTVRAITKSGEQFKGVLYGGFMDTQEGIYLLEFNVRFGDPEALNVLSIMETPLTDVGFSIIEGNLLTPKFRNMGTVCVYLVPKGYPTNPKTGKTIKIQEPKKSQLYYASVYRDGQEIKTTGSRAIALLAKGKTIPEAREKVYNDIPKIEGELFYRTDIAKDI
jgi:phosphoribosylamine--glycine ligase